MTRDLSVTIPVRISEVMSYYFRGHNSFFSFPYLLDLYQSSSADNVIRTKGIGNIKKTVTLN